MIRPESRAFLLLLGLLTSMVALAIDMSLPTLPTLMREFSASPDQVQLTLSLFMIGYAVGQVIFGPFSDRFGRRPALLIGLGVYMAAGLGCALSTNIGMLVAFRTVMGFGGCSGRVLSTAVVRDHFSGERAAQMFSSLTAVFALAPLVAPTVGGFLLVHFGWRAIFVLLILIGIALSLLVWFGLAESLKHPDHEALRFGRMAGNYKTFLTNRTCLGFALVNALAWSGIFVFISASPFVLIEVYGVAPENFGFFFGTAAASLIVGSIINKNLLRRIHNGRVLQLGFATSIFGSAIVLLSALTGLAGAYGVTVGFAFYVAGCGMIMPNATAAALEPVPRMAGMASALMGLIQMGLGSIAGYIASLLYDGTAHTLGIMVPAMIVLSFLLYHFWIHGRPLRHNAA